MRHELREKKNKGFVALISAIIISAVLLAIAFTVSMTSIFGRFNILDAESKERSTGLAEACVDMAILKLANNQDYMLTAADHAITVIGSDTCNIFSLSPATPRTFPITIQTQAIIDKAYTNLIVVIDSSYNIISWDEVPHS